jgi:DNA (cytosine-5)-methyltransferase 1
MTFGSLFAGIGGMDLGLERAGLTCCWQVEIEPFCRKVLARHWPDVRRHDDVRTFPPMQPEDWHVDLIAGGFPCQDISFAGKGAGLSGKRSGLWYEFARIVRVLRPRYVLVENVSALLVRGLDAVLGTLASLGYDAEWGCIPAAAVGAPHIRERVFLLAYSQGGYARGITGSEGQREWPDRASRGPGFLVQPGHGREVIADPENVNGFVYGTLPREPILSRTGSSKLPTRNDIWTTEPDLGRVADGIPTRVDRLKGLGNAVVPQVAEWIGRQILESMESHP